MIENQKVNIVTAYKDNVTQDLHNVKHMKFNLKTDTLSLYNLREEIHGLGYCPGGINLKSFHHFKLQVLGATKIIRHLLTKIRKSQDSSILFFSIVVVQYGFNFYLQVATVEVAIGGLTRSLSILLASTIGVNAIAPCLKNTNLTSKFLNIL